MASYVKYFSKGKIEDVGVHSLVPRISSGIWDLSRGPLSSGTDGTEANRSLADNSRVRESVQV